MERIINVVPGGGGILSFPDSKVDYNKAIVHRIHLESLIHLHGVGLWSWKKPMGPLAGLI